MPDIPTLTIFVTAALVLLVTPGPAVLYIIARSIEQGRLAGLVSGLGLSCGGLAHVAAATLGLSALLLSSALAFEVVKYLGAAYLIYLGLRTLAARSVGPAIAPELRRRRLSRIFFDGVIVNLLNPKAALFFLAFLPQFVDPGRGAVNRQVLTLGLIFIALGMLTDATYALIAGTVGGWLRARPRLLGTQRLLSGLVYLGLGLAAALAGGQRR